MHIKSCRGTVSLAPLFHAHNPILRPNTENDWEALRSTHN